MVGMPTWRKAVWSLRKAAESCVLNSAKRSLEGRLGGRTGLYAISGLVVCRSFFVMCAWSFLCFSSFLLFFHVAFLIILVPFWVAFLDQTWSPKSTCTLAMLWLLLICHWLHNTFCDLEGATLVSFGFAFRFVCCSDFWHLFRSFLSMYIYVCVCVRVQRHVWTCVCVCVRARARVCVCVLFS